MSFRLDDQATGLQIDPAGREFFESYYGRLIGGAPIAVQGVPLLELLRSAPEVGLVADAALLGVLASEQRGRSSGAERRT